MDKILLPLSPFYCFLTKLSSILAEHMYDWKLPAPHYTVSTKVRDNLG